MVTQKNGLIRNTKVNFKMFDGTDYTINNYNLYFPIYQQVKATRIVEHISRLTVSNVIKFVFK